MNKPVTIPKELPGGDSALSYDFLREEGIRHIQQLAGDTWTDHNIHDPGITILEQLCYALTDAAYRMDFDIRDLLAKEGGHLPDELFSPATILTVNPVTLQDLRKVVIDVRGVKNAWVEKATPDALQEAEAANARGVGIKGLYRIAFEVDEWVAASPDLLQQVKARLHACRGLAEDTDEVRLLAPQFIKLEGAIEIGKQVEDINQLVANALYQVGSFLSPRVPFYTLEQLQTKGMPLEEIFDGPVLTHGFIEEEDLLRFQRVKEVHASDLMRELLDVAGVKTITSLAMATGEDTVKNWVMPIDPSKTPRLDVKATLRSLAFTIQGIPAKIHEEEVKKRYEELGRKGLSRELEQGVRDLLMEGARNRNLSQYFSVQNEFPANYGLGSFELPDNAPEERKAQARQLKAYLTFFEQALTNYFAQLAHFKDLVSFEGADARTYFNQTLIETVTGLEEILVDPEQYAGYLEETSAETDASLTRKNQFLNHLLARFGEDFAEYALLLQEDSADSEPANKKLIMDKSRFLKTYPEVSSDRSRAFDYSQPSWGTGNVSGLEKRIAGKLGIEDRTRRSLSAGETEGFHLVEHILLRPNEKEAYPFRSHYLPGEITAFEPGREEGQVSCVAAGHTLQVGESIQILGGENEDKQYQVQLVDAEAFEIVGVIEELPEAANWKRTQPDIRYLTLTHPIRSTSKSDQGRLIVQVDAHALQVGDQVEVTGTSHIGIHTVTRLVEQGFEIDQPFEAEGIYNWWMPAKTNQDDYSLQLTFTFPNWIGRFVEASFRQLVDNTVREETPAHLKVYIKWLDKAEMTRFDAAYERFLATLKSST